MSDLKTTEGVLEWVTTCSRAGCGCCADGDSPEDIAEAARIALAMRVLEIVEREAAGASAEWDGFRIRLSNILAEAKKESK